jgi:malonate decarboxylase gamma subunit
MSDLSSTERLIGDFFGDDAVIRREGDLIIGEGRLDGCGISILGTADRTYIGADAAIAMARHVLDIVSDRPRQPILIIVDNSGHRLGRWDELMANNGCIAHLTKCLDLARRSGHRVIGVVNELAVSAGFMALGMATDTCYALPEAEVRVMAPNAMSRVMRVPLDRLTELCQTSPVLGPGVQNFMRVGAIRDLWAGDLAGHLRTALAEAPPAGDTRRNIAHARGGRLLAREVADLVRSGAEA